MRDTKECRLPVDPGLVGQPRITGRRGRGMIRVALTVIAAAITCINFIRYSRIVDKHDEFHNDKRTLLRK